MVTLKAVWAENLAPRFPKRLMEQIEFLNLFLTAQAAARIMRDH
jgi:hypothetical protein